MDHEIILSYHETMNHRKHVMKNTLRLCHFSEVKTDFLIFRKAFNFTFVQNLAYELFHRCSKNNETNRTV